MAVRNSSVVFADLDSEFRRVWILVIGDIIAVKVSLVVRLFDRFVVKCLSKLVTNLCYMNLLKS